MNIQEKAPIHIPHVPLSAGEEFVNWLTHGSAAILGIVGACIMGWVASSQSLMTAICCVAFVLSAVAVFSASALSHYCIHRPTLLNRLRAWDQGLIYVMISGTYTPIVWSYAESTLRWPLMIFIWVGALVGLYSKVIAKHRVNSIRISSYVLLAAIPSIALFNRVPNGFLYWMLLGCAFYVLGIVFLLNDRKIRYMHLAWHMCVNSAAILHFYGVYAYIAQVA